MKYFVVIVSQSPPKYYTIGEFSMQSKSVKYVIVIIFVMNQRI